MPRAEPVPEPRSGANADGTPMPRRVTPVAVVAARRCPVATASTDLRPARRSPRPNVRRITDRGLGHSPCLGELLKCCTFVIPCLGGIPVDNPVDKHRIRRKHGFSQPNA
jgi:hypothetical protein